jgi:Tfp pilus assembly protein PilF
MRANAKYNRGKKSMTSKRPVVLMAILLILLAACFALPRLQNAYFGWSTSAPSAASDPPALAGINSVSNLVVTQQADGRWMVSFDYFYTGAPRAATLEVFQVVTGSTPGSVAQNHMTGAASAKRGANHYSGEIHNPRPYEMAVTTQVYATMQVAGVPRPAPIARIALDQRIQWPDPVVLEVEQAIAAGRPETIVQRAVGLIDSNERPKLENARALLQALVERRPRTDSAYVELGRVAMKTNWSAVGLREAEALIRSALQISPDSANAKILLGYVLAHQGRFRDAEPLFVQAAASNPPNLWLWANWGQLMDMQGKKEAAIGKYREAVTRPPTKDTYDRARQDAYSHLLLLLAHRGDLDGIEALYKQRAQEYPGSECFSIEYARFLVLQRADAARATAVLRDSPAPQCDAAKTREVQGLAHYVNWSRAQDPGRAESLLQARAFLPAGPNLFYALASTDRTAAIVQQLIASGDKLGAQDNRGFDALGYALRTGDAVIARRLLRLGAKPDAEEGPERMPAALIPVLTQDLEIVRLLQRAGVDYNRLRFQGTTAVEYARNLGNSKLMEVLDPKAGAL